MSVSAKDVNPLRFFELVQTTSVLWKLPNTSSDVNATRFMCSSCRYFSGQYRFVWTDLHVAPQISQMWLDSCGQLKLRSCNFVKKLHHLLWTFHPPPDNGSHTNPKQWAQCTTSYGGGVPRVLRYCNIKYLYKS